MSNFHETLAVRNTPRDVPAWVVNELGELGVYVNGRFFFLYKGESLEYGKASDEPDYKVRLVQKREFGETCLSPYQDLMVEDMEPMSTLKP